MIKQRHLQLLGYALVNVAYWEWNGLRPGQREDYLRRRLQIEPGTIGGNVGREPSSEGHADAIGSADIVHSLTSGEDASDESEESMTMKLSSDTLSKGCQHRGHVSWDQLFGVERKDGFYWHGNFI